MKKKAETAAVDPGVQAAEAALLMRATGYRTTETRATEGGGITNGQVVTTEKFVPPDTRALIFFLKNKLPDQWRDKERNVESASEPLGEDPFVTALKACAHRLWPADPAQRN